MRQTETADVIAICAVIPTPARRSCEAPLQCSGISIVARLLPCERQVLADSGPWANADQDAGALITTNWCA